MVMVRIAHLADTHLGYKQYNLEEREQDIYDALEEIASKILEESVDIVLHSGDLFDSWRPTARAYYEFKKFLNKLDKMKVKVYTILGDHDRPKKLGLPPHRLFEDKIEILGIASAEHRILKLNDEELFIAGISNLNRRYREVLLQELKKLDIQAAKYKKSILMLHQAIDKFAPEEVFEVKLEELPRNFKYIAMGHLHTRVRATHGNGELAYPGSIEILRRDEITGYEKHGKGFYLIDIEGDEARISEVKLNVRPQIKAKLSYAEF
ncbi:MAG: DNA repair exonuclease, partial [Halobacteria archaeon]